jgi:hypothetical protein
MSTARESTRERAQRLAARARALEALCDLDIADELAALTTADRRVTAAQRAVERTERELASARQARREAADVVRSAVAATGATPQAAASVLGISASLCRPVGDEGAADSEDSEDPTTTTTSTTAWEVPA